MYGLAALSSVFLVRSVYRSSAFQKIQWPTKALARQATTTKIVIRVKIQQKAAFTRHRSGCLCLGIGRVPTLRSLPAITSFPSSPRVHGPLSRQASYTPYIRMVHEVQKSASHARQCHCPKDSRHTRTRRGKQQKIEGSRPKPGPGSMMH